MKLKTGKLKTGIFLGLGLLSALCAQPALSDVVSGYEPEIDVGYAPELDSLEGGLWHQMAEFEELVRTQAKRVDDPKLTQYIEHIVCDVAALDAAVRS